MCTKRVHILRPPNSKLFGRVKSCRTLNQNHQFLFIEILCPVIVPANPHFGYDAIFCIVGLPSHLFSQFGLVEGIRCTTHVSVDCLGLPAVTDKAEDLFFKHGVKHHLLDENLTNAEQTPHLKSRQKRSAQFCTGC